jgi:hypothetical protein
MIPAVMSPQHKEIKIHLNLMANSMWDLKTKTSTMQTVMLLK